MLHGLSRALWEEVQFDTEKVTSVDWASHPSLRHSDTPETIDIVLVNGDPNPNRPDLPHYGAGETSHKPRDRGGRECHLRRDRRAVAPRAVPQGTRARGAAGGGVVGAASPRERGSRHALSDDSRTSRAACRRRGPRRRCHRRGGGGGRSDGGVISKRCWPEAGSIERSNSVQNVISFATVLGKREYSSVTR